MDNPFVFDKPVEGEKFTGREWIMARVLEQLLATQNVILLSPRGWGKTSLAMEVSYRIWRYHASYRTCFVPIQPGMTVKEFGDVLLHQISMVPGIRTIVNQNDYLDDTETFNLPEVFAVLNQIKLIICIAGIHNILDLNKSAPLLTKLSKTWVMHRNCSYLLLGSVSVSGLKNKMQIHPQASKIGRTFHLERFSQKESTAYIIQKFDQTDKQIHDPAVLMISQFTNQIPYFLQLLAWHSWVNTGKECTTETVKKSIELITGHYRLQFQSITENLTQKQLKYVQWFTLEGYQPYSMVNIATYNLNASGNVARLYQSMLKKEIIIDHQGETIFSNPFYRHWLENYYFR